MYRLWIMVVFACLCTFNLVAQNSHKKDTILLGVTNRQAIASNCPWFKTNYQKYYLNDTAVQSLKAFAEFLSFTLVIGTWCSDSKEHIPAFYKLMDSLLIGEDKIVVYAVNRKKERVITKEIKAIKFKYLPTIVVYYKKKEIGRIVEDTKISMENDILEMFKK